MTLVSRDFFRALGIPVREGRTFDSQDTVQSLDNIVVNEAFARKILPGEKAVGSRINSGRDDATHWTIVGVVANIRGSELGAEPAPLVYRCICQSTSPYLSRMGLIFRTSGDPRPAIRAVESQVYAVDRGQPVFDVRTMDERLADSLAPQRFNLILIGHVRGNRSRPGSPGSVRSDVLPGEPADPRNRHPDCAGSAFGAGDAAGGG